MRCISDLCRDWRKRNYRDGSTILAGVYVGKNVKVGKNCKIYPYAVIYDDVIVE